MIDRIKKLLLMLCATQLIGCETQLISKPISEETSDTGRNKGLTYFLPAKQFTVSASYSITGCEFSENTLSLDAEIEANISELLIGSTPYTIDYSELNEWTKITNTEFVISESGLLTSINASITDQSGSIIKNTAVTVASIARATALPSVPLGAIPTGLLEQTKKSVEEKNASSFSTNVDLISSEKWFINPQLASELKRQNVARNEDKIIALLEKAPCSKIIEKITDVEDTKKKLKETQTIDKLRNNLELEVAELNLQIDALNKQVETYNKLGHQIDKTELLNKIKFYEAVKDNEIKKLKSLGESATDKLLSKLSKLTSELSFVVVDSFVPDSSNSNLKIAPTGQKLARLLNNLVDISTVKIPTVELKVDPIETINRHTPKSGITGIAYRIPVPVKAVLAIKRPDNSELHVIQITTQAPQFGPVGILDLKNTAFDDNLIEVAFNGTTGSPSKVTFKAKSKADAASDAGKGAAETYMQLQSDKRDDLIAAQKAVLQQQSSQVVLNKSLLDLRSAEVTTENTTAMDQIKLQEASLASQLKMLRDQQRIDSVKTGTANAAEIELEALKTQEELLIQRIKIMKLEQDLASQKAAEEALD